MQLIFDTEHTADIKGNMSILEESVGENLISDTIMDSLKHISNGNKENIQKQDNISKNEKKTVNNIKLYDEELSTPVVEVDVEEVIKESKNTDDNEVSNNPEELVNNDLSDTTESHSNCDDVEKVLLETEQDEFSQENVSNSGNSDEKDDLQHIEQEVDDILSQQVSNLTNTAEQEEAHDSTVEPNDRMKEVKENLVKSIQTGQILEDDGSAEESSQENSSLQKEDDVTPLVNNIETVNEETQENQVVDVSEITSEVTTSCVKKESEKQFNNEDSKCTETEDNKEKSCIETFTIQDENDDIVDKALPELMDVDDVCKGIDSTSDKEDNEVTLLDSPVNADTQKNKEQNNSSDTAMDCGDVSEIVDRNEVIEIINKDKVSEIVDTVSETNDLNEASEIITKESNQDATFVASKDEVMIIDKAKENTQQIVEEKQDTPPKNQIEKEPEKTTQKISPIMCRLSNSLNILSDDEDEPPKTEPAKEPTPEKQCINLEDDDDIMLIDEDTNSKIQKTASNKTENDECESAPKQNELVTDLETGEKTSTSSAPETSTTTIDEYTSSTNEPCVETSEQSKVTEEKSQTVLKEKPLLPDNFLKSSKKNIADMTREDLEEFCILKIVESIVDRSNLSEIKTKLKAMAQNLEDYKKKAMMLTKQNRDLEVVLKSVQEEQKRTKGAMVTPLKITRSVGMQVYMTDKLLRKKSVGSVPQPPVATNNKTRSAANNQPKPNKTPCSPTIPVPRLIPANNAAIRGPVSQSSPVNSGKQANTVHVNGVRNPAPVQKIAEKRPIGRSQSVTVDLTDDEPPAKVASRGPTPPVRLVPSQNLLAPQRAQFAQAMNTPRKVYIPISGPQGQQIKPGQTIMVKTSPTGPNRPRPIAPTITRLTTNQMRMTRMGQTTPRHPAALPDVVKQYQPPNWKALPPAPDLKLSKVENGIVISWKIEGYLEDSYEEIASYQLYAYQETSSPPSTSLWKKIGDVKALPLPMACTLTQFMAGFKYYFAVRAVDVKSRVGPFSLPGSILLLNKIEEKYKELKRKRNCERQRAYYHRQKDLKKNEEKTKKKVPKTNAERQREFRQRKAEKSYVDM